MMSASPWLLTWANHDSKALQIIRDQCPFYWSINEAEIIFLFPALRTLSLAFVILLQFHWILGPLSDITFRYFQQILTSNIRTCTVKTLIQTIKIKWKVQRTKNSKRKSLLSTIFFFKVTNKNEWMQKYMEENISLTTME